MRGIALLAVMSGMFTLPSAVLGQDAEPDVGEALQLFDEGQAHFEAGRFEAAAEAFQHSYELMRQADHPNAPIILYNVGTSLDEIPGREADARDAYIRLLAQADPTHELIQERSVQVQARIRGLDQILANSGTTSGGSDSISPVGPIFLAIGGATVVAGGILFSVALAENDAFLAMCTDGVCPTDSRPVGKNVETLGIATDALVMSGVLIAATGLVLTLVLQEGGGDTTAGGVCTSDGCLGVVGWTF